MPAKTASFRGSFLNDQCTSTHNSHFFCPIFLLDLIVGHLEHVLQNENIYTENLKNKLK